MVYRFGIRKAVSNADVGLRTWILHLACGLLESLLKNIFWHILKRVVCIWSVPVARSIQGHRIRLGTTCRCSVFLCLCRE